MWIVFWKGYDMSITLMYCRCFKAWTCFNAYSIHLQFIFIPLLSTKFTLTCMYMTEGGTHVTWANPILTSIDTYLSYSVQANHTSFSFLMSIYCSMVYAYKEYLPLFAVLWQLLPTTITFLVTRTASTWFLTCSLFTNWALYDGGRDRWKDSYPIYQLVWGRVSNICGQKDGCKFRIRDRNRRNVLYPASLKKALPFSYVQSAQTVKCLVSTMTKIGTDSIQR